MNQVSEQLVVRMSPQSKALLEERAARLGLSTSSYARLILSGRVEPLEPTGEGGEPLPRLLTR